MSKKYRLNQQQLLSQWDEEIEMLRDVCDNFDGGDEKTARSLAVILRILFHETKNSKSLWRQVKQYKNIYFYSLSDLYSPANLVSSWTLLMMEIENGRIRYVADLASGNKRTFFFTFEDWWNEIIFDDKQHVYTRRDIVLFVANQDGGAHVDPEIDEKYAKLKYQNSLGWVDVDGNKPLNNPIYQAIRVIAQEVLISIQIFRQKLKGRKCLNNREMEMRYKDNNRRYKWSMTDISASEETIEIVKKDRMESRKLYSQELENGRVIELMCP